MDKHEEQEMKMSKPVAKDKLNKWYEWLIGYVLKLFNFNNSILSLDDGP